MKTYLLYLYLIVIIISNSACNPALYFPAPVYTPALSKEKSLTVNVGSSLFFLPPYSIQAAYSPKNHIGIMAEAHKSNFNWGSPNGERETYKHKDFNLGFGYYKKNEKYSNTSRTLMIDAYVGYGKTYTYGRSTFLITDSIGKFNYQSSVSNLAYNKFFIQSSAILISNQNITTGLTLKYTLARYNSVISNDKAFTNAAPKVNEITPSVFINFGKGRVQPNFNVCIPLVFFNGKYEETVLSSYIISLGFRVRLHKI